MFSAGGGAADATPPYDVRDDAAHDERLLADGTCEAAREATVPLDAAAAARGGAAVGGAGLGSAGRIRFSA